MGLNTKIWKRKYFKKAFLLNKMLIMLLIFPIYEVFLFVTSIGKK